jgi:small-conductance mechanosensitive channel
MLMKAFFGIENKIAGRALWSAWRHGLCAVLLIWSLPAALGQSPLSPVVAQKPETTNAPVSQAAPDAATMTRTIEEKLARARADLAAAKTLDTLNGTNVPSGISLRDFAIQRGLLERLVRLYEQQLSYIAELEAARTLRAEQVNEARLPKGFAGPRQHSILQLDALRESIQMEQQEVSSGETALKTLDKLIEEHQSTLKQAEESLRQINEKIERSPSANDQENRIWMRDLERLRSQVATATMAVLDLERQIRMERLAGHRARLDLLQKQLVIVRASATFTDEDMEKVSNRLDAGQRDLEKEIADALTRQQSADRSLEDARKTLQQAQARKEVGNNQIARLTGQLELRREETETAQNNVKMLRFLLQIAVTERTIWELRFAAYRSGGIGTVRDIRRQLDQADQRVNLWKNYYQQEMETCAGQIAQLEARLADMDPASDRAPLVRGELASLRERDDMFLRVVRGVGEAERLVDRLREGVKDASDNLPFYSRLGDAFSDARTVLGRVWGFELFVAQDTITVEGQKITGKRSVTVGKIVTAVLILVVGYWLARRVADFLQSLFVRRFKVEANQANLIRQWFRVVLIFALLLFSLASVKIPLTVFAFAGGALAIGLGFGLQTILKNFVSGIIILFERPFRVGDVLDVAGQRGTVGSIGIRSSVLQMWDGTDTLIPNSVLLENNLTNWTYSSRAVRFTVGVGVSYGSDPKRVIQLLGEIAGSHAEVEKDPKPQVLFTNFGPSTLDFELRFWVDVTRASSAQVASDLRQRIVGTFAEHALVMAFPQQDVHLDAGGPLQVQLVRSQGTHSAAKGTKHQAGKKERS